MGRNKFIFVSDDNELTNKVKNYGEGIGQDVHTYSSEEWSQNMMDPEFLSWLKGSSATVSHSGPVGGNVLPFPQAIADDADDSKVRTINELESMAIENAIYEYNGNLTEAAKALGIGRATLYRKVKLYNIDPSGARKRKAA